MQGLLELTRKTAPWVPFTTSYIIRQCFDTKRTALLDVGCGTGGPMRSMPQSKLSFSVGADIFPPYLRECKALAIHNDVVLCDIRMLPFRAKSFDVVLCLSVLEHLRKEDAWKLLGELEEIARRCVIINAPLGFSEHGVTEDNPYQIHQSGFYPNEFRRAGYEVRGQGMGIRFDIEGFFHYRMPAGVRLLWNVFHGLANPFFYFFPRFAGTMTAVKRLPKAKQQR